MPRKENWELVELRQENASQRQQIEVLVKQISMLQSQLQEALEGNTDLKKQLKEFQEKLDDVLFQLKNLNRQEYGPSTERNNPRQGPPPDDTELDDSDSSTNTS